MAESLIRIIIDTDLAMGEPGAPVDDGFALALAIADPELRLELVTTIDGNSQIHKVTRLTTKLLGRLDHPRVAVVPGAAGTAPRRMLTGSVPGPSSPRAAGSPRTGTPGSALW